MKSNKIEERQGKFGRLGIGVLAIGAQSSGAIAVGALAVSALAAGFIGIGRLVIGRAKIKRLEIGGAQSNTVACDRLNEHAAIGTPASRFSTGNALT